MDGKWGRDCQPHPHGLPGASRGFRSSNCEDFPTRVCTHTQTWTQTPCVHLDLTTSLFSVQQSGALGEISACSLRFPRKTISLRKMESIAQNVF